MNPHSLDDLPPLIRAAYHRTQVDDKEWVEGTLELAALFAEGRRQFPKGANKKFSDWINDNKLDFINDHDRSALLKIASNDPVIVRDILGKTHRRSWKHVWAEDIKPSISVVQMDKRPPDEQPLHPHERLRAAIIADPLKPNSHFKKEFNVANETVKRERDALVKSKRIDFIPARTKNIQRDMEWGKIPSSTAKLLSFFDGMAQYCADASRDMPESSKAILLCPSNEQEETCKILFIKAIQRAQKSLKKLEEEFGGERAIQELTSKSRNTSVSVH